MDAIVIDASVAVPLLCPERESETIKAALIRWRQTGHRLVVPGHFWLEVLNSLGRRHLYAGADVIEALRELDELELETVTIERPVHLLIADLMERFGLTSYDAAYLGLAEVIDARLATMDTDLSVAAAGRWLDPLGSSGAHRLSETRAPYGTDVSVSWPRWSGAGAYLAELRARALAGERS